MPLSPPVNRALRHRRAITAEAYLRDDGLWDIEARLTDTKPRDIELAGNRIRPEGQPLHDLWLPVTIDLRLNIVDAEACSDWVPYPTHCDTIGPAYRQLIGLNLTKGFRKAVRDRLGSLGDACRPELGQGLCFLNAAAQVNFHALHDAAHGRGHLRQLV